MTRNLHPAPVLAVLLFLGGACAHDSGPQGGGAAAEQKPPAVSEEFLAAARAALGADAEVLLSGDLAGVGAPQVVAVNRLPSASNSPVTAPVTGITVTRVSILSREDRSWREALRCDGYLKNSSGYLPGTPAQAVASWNLETEHAPGQGLVLRFTPLGQSAGGKSPTTITVRWNPKVKRYQTVDRTGQQFLSETTSLEKAEVKLRK